MDSAQSDRTVHAVLRAPYEIVRYDRAGKWYIEGRGEMSYWRKCISITEAARLASDDGKTVYFGRPGGKMFDAKVRGLA